ncbi:hypothetical protein PybrP1_008541 [[Pythium] brassicae (nom. inval.)]|nr:hypothetical protein PybrP1_008541 [[Pythium] brassicae (nom. inval.)]
MPWTANNNQAGEIRAPATAAALRQQQQQRAAAERVYAQQLRVVALEELAAVDAAALRHCALFVVAARAHAAVARGHIALPQAHLANLELCVGQEERWSLFQERVPPAAVLAVEIRPLQPPPPRERVVTDAAAFATALAVGLQQRVLTENERVVMRFAGDGRDYFVRVLAVDAEDASETDFTMPDAFRGVVDAATQVVISADAPDGDARFALTNTSDTGDETIDMLHSGRRSRADVVTVVTSDDEEFPVKKKLLFPCIRLSSAVLAGQGVHRDASSTVAVAVDCLTFDRVLLYLEHEARGEPGAAFQFDPAHAEELLAAATTLGCAGLQDVCQQRLGEFATRVRKDAIRWDEVERRNRSGEVWLVMLGMVFDVTRWLPEHPGGSVIIPEQAVNVDCTVMFEIYHSSRQSFRYLKQFYIGELEQADLALVPRSPEAPSAAFIDELKQYTTWRVTPLVATYKSF